MAGDQSRVYLASHLKSDGIDTTDTLERISTIEMKQRER